MYAVYARNGGLMTKNLRQIALPERKSKKGRGSVADAGHSLHGLILLGIEALLHAKAIVDIKIDHFAPLGADHAVGLALSQCHHGMIAHVRCHDAETYIDGGNSPRPTAPR